MKRAAVRKSGAVAVGRRVSMARPYGWLRVLSSARRAILATRLGYGRVTRAAYG